MHAVRLALMLAALSIPTAAAVAQSVTIEMVRVGDPGNASDTINHYPYENFGAVPHEYRIGTYEVTIGQFTSFLNAVARTDSVAIYADQMAAEQHVAGISRSGSSGSYLYRVIGPFGVAPPGADSPENRPVTFVSWYDAARFANWMSNGQPTGGQVPTTSENGAYLLHPLNQGPIPSPNRINPNTGATPRYRIPTENEWYKAAYYKGGGTNAGYWRYATQSDSFPGNTIGGASNQANHYVGTYPNGSYATVGGVFFSGQNYLTNVGAFSGSPSAYGTFDQSGNVREWNDLSGSDAQYRGLRGGTWGASDLSSSDRAFYWESFKISDATGFRLAASTDIEFMMPSGTIRTQAQALYPRLTPDIATSVTIASGTVVFDADNTYIGPTVIREATLQVRGPHALRVTPITIDAGGTLALPTDTALGLSVSGLTVAEGTGGLVDLGRGRIDIAPGGMTAAAVQADLLAGRAGGSYAGGGGITSSVVAAEIGGGQPRAVGWLEQGDGSLTVAYAAPGDTNCDWIIDVLDAANFLGGGRFDAGPAAIWSQGDFTYDQLVDILDAAAFVATGLFDAGTYNASAGSPAAVPEPCAGPLALAGLAGGACRCARRRSRKRS